MAEHEHQDALNSYCVALYVYEPAEIEVGIAEDFFVNQLVFARGRYGTGPDVRVQPPRLTLRTPGVYGWVAEIDIPFAILSGWVEVLRKAGIGAGKDPWPPPPPPPPPFSVDRVAASRFPVHAYAHPMMCDGFQSELFMGGLDGIRARKQRAAITPAAAEDG